MRPSSVSIVLAALGCMALAGCGSNRILIIRSEPADADVCLKGKACFVCQVREYVS